MSIVSPIKDAREKQEPHAPRVPADWIRGRLERTRAAMKAEGVDCLVVAGEGLISHYGYLEYILGFSPVVRNGYVVIGPDTEPIVVMSTRSDAYFAEQQGVYADVRVAGHGDVVGQTNSTGDVVAEAVRDSGAESGRVGVVGMANIMPSRDVDAIRAALPSAQISDMTELLGAVKAVKMPEEDAEIAMAAHVADEAFEAFMTAARSTRRSWEIYGEMERALRSNGARDSLIFIGRGPYFLHRPFDDELLDGDLVTVYVETIAPNGYWVEKAGLFSFGEPSEEQLAYGHAAIAGLDAAQKAMVEGARASDVARALEDQVSHLDARTGIWHGHGVGIDHDSPVIGTQDDTILRDGMLIAVHPNLTNQAETVGTSVADTFLIRDGKATPISRFPQEIRVIETENR